MFSPLIVRKPVNPLQKIWPTRDGLGHELNGEIIKDGCHTPFWKNQLRYTRNLLHFAYILPRYDFIPDCRHTVWWPFSGLQGLETFKKGHPRGLWGILLTSTALLLCQIIAATMTALLTIATPTTAISGATATTIGNGLLPGAATTALFGPAVARNGQKGSPHRSAGHPTGLWVILTSTTSARLLLRLFALPLPLPLPLLLVVRYCYGYTEWAPARGGHCDPFRASKTSKRSKRVAAGVFE